MAQDKFWPKGWPRPSGKDAPPPEPEAPPVSNPSVKPEWHYDKNQLMWRRDMLVRVFWSPTNHSPRWVAVNSMLGRLEPDFDTAEAAKAAADKAWPA